MLSGAIRVLIADTSPTRLGVRLALEGAAVICAEAMDRPGAVAAARRHQPDVCLVGRSLEGGGIGAVREISEAAPNAAIVVLADSHDTDDLMDALRAGAIGYLPVDFRPAQLRRAIDAVRSEQAAIPRAMVGALVREIHDLPERGRLTLRETQVLTMLRRGDSTAAIGRGLAISPVTVRRHISVLVRKAGVANRDELVGAGADATTRVGI